MMDKILLIVLPLSQLILAATIFSKRSQYERWAKIALVINAVGGVGWGVLGLIESRIGTHNRWYSYVSYQRSFCAGIVIGLMLILLLSGQLKTRRRPTGLEASEK
jgi:hypothetical protein